MVANVAGYNENGVFVSALLVGDNKFLMQKCVTIPSGIASIVVSLGNSTHSEYRQNTGAGVSIPYSRLSQSLASILSLLQNVANLTNSVDQLFLNTDMATYESVQISSYSQGVFWTTSGSLSAGKYVVQGITDLNLAVGIATQLAYSSIIRTPELTVYGTNIIFEITDQDITDGGKYLRLATTDGQTPILLYQTSVQKINDVVRQLQQETGALVTLTGKKISVIGDSISTINGNNNPYWKVLSVDVGQQIQAWVTWWDVWANDAGTTPTGKTIGGVALTAEMIGTKQTFTPVAGDVGKTIGTPLNYNGSGTKVWSEKLCEMTGAILLANASWSGSRICSGQTGQWQISEAWHDLTIGCCKTRDENGNDVIPDIIIIYRGTNDFSHGPISRIDDVSLANGVPSTDYINSLYEYRAGYYKTIQKLRTAYPKAYIICCTLNVFKRMTYDVFPTRNEYYTLPEMNNVIRDIANTMGCGLIEFDKDGITFENCYADGYITDSSTMPTHPNSKGHAVMADRALADIKYFLQQ